MAESTDSKLSDFKVIIFDVYGTLIDVRKGVIDGLRPLFAKYPQVSLSDLEIWDMYDKIEHEVEKASPTMRMDQVILEVWDRIEDKLYTLTTESASGSPERSDEDQQHRLAFGDGVQTYPVFPDTGEALQRLMKHYKLTILSNMDHKGIENSHAKMAEGESQLPEEVLKAYGYPEPNPHGQFWFPIKLDKPGTRSPFTMIATAQDTGAYKPDLKGFRLVLEAMEKNTDVFPDVTSDKVLSVAQSLKHDHIPAHQLGLHSVWIDRPGQGHDIIAQRFPGAKYNWRFDTLGEFADALEKELGHSL